MADQLVSLETVVNMLGLSAAGSAGRIVAQILIDEVSAAITESCNRQNWLVTSGPETRYLSGQGDPWIVYPIWPIRQVAVYGDTVSGSAIVTSLAFTDPYTVANLFVDQSVQGSGIPAGTSISAVGSTSLTLSQAATATATQALLLCGLAVYEDDGTSPAWGQGDGSFGSGTLLSPGADYAVRWDNPDGLQPNPTQQSKCGMLYRTGTGVWPQLWNRQPGGLAIYGIGGAGNVKVVANQGFPAIPADLELAALRCVTKLRFTCKYGQPVTGGGMDGANISFGGSGGSPLNEALGVLGGDVANVIARYRILATVAGVA